MFRVYINQKKNNLFFNIFNENNKNIFYNSIGIEFDSGKSISFFLIEFLIDQMFFYLLKNFKKNYFFYNGFIYKKFKNKKIKKIFIFFILKIFYNYEDFLIPILNNFKNIKLNFYKIIFLSNFSHGGCKLNKFLRKKKK